ncbi:MAG: alpha/beta hydrolase [Rhodospirillales bacterium]|nr:alpha/beta hydrolase [Rhodospirillales bacterium]
MDDVVERLVLPNEELEYRWVGDENAEGPVLVFLHEGLGCAALWKDFPDKVAAAAGRRGLVYSRSCYGHSSYARLPRAVEFMHTEGLEILPQVLETAGIEKAILIGHSDGASISLINAGGVKDGRVQALILEAPHVFVEKFAVDAISETRETYLNTDLRKKLRRYHGLNVDNAFWGWNDIWLDPDFLEWNIEEYLPKITVPTLIIQGEGDEYGTMEQVVRTEAGIGGKIETCILPDCGHSPHNTKPEETLEAMVSFIKGLA